MENDASNKQLDVFSRVWDIYDDYKTSLFNERYFERKLSKLQSWSLRFDILTAVGTSTTGIAGWALWSQPQFQPIWAAIAGVAVTMSIVKPILKWNDQMIGYSKQFNAHSKISGEYKGLITDIGYRHELTEAMIRRHEEIIKSTEQIERLPQGPPRVLKLIQGEVNEKIPFDRLWSPPGLATGASI
jgi:hypothetical protein